MESVAFHISVPKILRLQVKERSKILFVFSTFFFLFFKKEMLSLDLKVRLNFFYHSVQRCSCTSCPHQYLILLDDVLSCKGFECHRQVPDPGSFWLASMSNVSRNVPKHHFEQIKITSERASEAAVPCCGWCGADDTIKDTCLLGKDLDILFTVEEIMCTASIAQHDLNNRYWSRR